MKKYPTLLLVEEDLFTAELLAEQLEGHFDIFHVSEISATQASICHKLPAAVLLNAVNASGSGLEVCQAIRENSETLDLPVIFLTDNASNDELFSIYEVGGDDYLPRSLAKLELCSRIKHTLTQCTERSQLKTQLSNAFTVAMSAMSSAAEVGEILQFLRESFTCTDYLSLCKAILKTLNSFGLDARVQIRGQQPTASYTALGSCSVVEESVFATMAKAGRLVSFSTHSACSYEHVTLIVKNMPRDNAELYGRMSDNLALLCEAINARVIALDNEISLAQQKEAYAHLVDVVNVSLVDMNQQLIDLVRQGLLAIIDQYALQRTQLLSLPDLSQNQMIALQNIFQQTDLGTKLKDLTQQVDYHQSHSE